MAPPSPLRILIVDDSEVVLNHDGSALTLAGFDVVTTTQPFAATRMLTKVDLVILDYHMPDVNGAELLASMREVCAKTGAPCVFYLSTLDEGAARDFKQLGFDGLLTGKGDGKSLVPQVKAIARGMKMRAIASRVDRGPKT